MSPRHVLAWVLVLAFLVAACTGGGTLERRSGGTETGAAWRTTPLVDVRTGETFTVDGLEGDVVALETMAVWCSTCRIQQAEVATALDRLGSENMVVVSVDVDPNERAADLARYAEELGFDWRFAVAPSGFARSLAAEFGDQVLSPPATPVILLDPSGSVVDAHVGVRNADELTTLFGAHLP